MLIAPVVRPVWGTFHFIAKSDHSMLSNRPVTGLGVRTLSPVVDTLKIPREVLEDIYGGIKQEVHDNEETAPGAKVSLPRDTSSQPSTSLQHHAEMGHNKEICEKIVLIDNSNNNKEILVDSNNLTNDESSFSS